MDRKYTILDVNGIVNVNSHGHHHFQVKIATRGYSRIIGYSPGFGSDTPLPRYATREIERRIVELHDSGLLRFFEFDAFGYRRYGRDLRYHDAEQWRATVDIMRTARH